MEREFYLQLARDGVRLPIAADMVLHEREDPRACRYCGECLGEVIMEAAHRFKMPLAFPLMDLRTEKEWMLTHLGVPLDEIDSFHFDDDLDEASISRLAGLATAAPTKRMEATLGALRHVAAHADKVPVGMCIGPFSLMTKMLADPIIAAYQVGIDPEDEEAELVLKLMEVATEAIIHWVRLQIDAGAKAICLCEPAYNIVYVSPRQIEDDPAILDTLVINFNRRIKAAMTERGVDLILHDCGELNEAIIRSFNSLDPAILSLGSPCKLPEVAHLISPRTVLMGNLPSKKFYADSEMTAETVTTESRKLLGAMKATGHPFILATECDVLCVPGCEHTIMSKVLALAHA
ncbi:MAG: hypothetical protein JJT96_13710 [Opitutales bacterium]|nr:hypothetical protein [Opitutales bacterium]